MPASPAFLTCCGLRGLLYTGLETSSPRVVQAMHWLNEHAQIDVNPGYDQRGYYTYLLGFARTMRACEVAGADFTNTAKLRDWRNLVTAELLKRQTGLGQWRKGERDWWENNPELITAYAIFTLSNTLL